MEQVAVTRPGVSNDNAYRVANIPLPREVAVKKIGHLTLSNFDIAAGVATVLMIWGPMLAGAIHGH
jgi:hypothetical protein